MRVDKETFSDHFIPLRGNFYFTKMQNNGSSIAAHKTSQASSTNIAPGKKLPKIQERMFFNEIATMVGQLMVECYAKLVKFRQLVYAYTKRAHMSIATPFWVRFAISGGTPRI